MEAIYGINPVKVLLRQQETGLERIIIASGRGGSVVAEIIETARQKKIPVEFRVRQCLDELAGSFDHQGVIGLRQAFVDGVLHGFPLRVAGAGDGGCLQDDGEQKPHDLDAEAVHEIHHNALDGSANKKLSEKSSAR